jgi:hypothetical protein
MTDTEFRNDLLITTFDEASNRKVMYLVPESEWKKFQIDEDSDLGAVIEPLLNAGCVLAAVPTTNIQSGGASCMLLNLASINVDPFQRNQDAVDSLRATHAAADALTASKKATGTSARK